MKNVSDAKTTALSMIAGVSLLFSGAALADVAKPTAVNHDASYSERSGKAQSLFYYARALFNQERFTEAAPHLATVLALDPQHRYAGQLLVAVTELQSMQDPEQRRWAKLRVMINMVSAAVNDLDASMMVLSQR